MPGWLIEPTRDNEDFKRALRKVNNVQNGQKMHKKIRFSNEIAVWINLFKLRGQSQSVLDFSYVRVVYVTRHQS